MEDYDFMDDHDPRDDDPSLVCIQCPKCSGTGSYDCHCGGDLCFCGAGEHECTRCDQEGHIYLTIAENEDRIKRHHEIMKALWGDQYVIPPTTEQGSKT